VIVQQIPRTKMVKSKLNDHLYLFTIMTQTSTYFYVILPLRRESSKAKVDYLKFYSSIPSSPSWCWLLLGQWQREKRQSLKSLPLLKWESGSSLEAFSVHSIHEFYHISQCTPSPADFFP
jgi:hypothetical protein